MTDTPALDYVRADKFAAAIFDTSADASKERTGTLGNLARCYQALREENAKLREQMQWRPIKSAPKDGTEIIGWDAVHEIPLYTLHYKAHTGWMTKTERWSGQVRYWRPAIKGPATPERETQ